MVSWLKVVRRIHSLIYIPFIYTLFIWEITVSKWSFYSYTFRMFWTHWYSSSSTSKTYIMPSTYPTSNIMSTVWSINNFMSSETYFVSTVWSFDNNVSSETYDFMSDAFRKTNDNVSPDEADSYRCNNWTANNNAPGDCCKDDNSPNYTPNNASFNTPPYHFYSTIATPYNHVSVSNSPTTLTYRSSD